MENVTEGFINVMSSAKHGCVNTNMAIVAVSRIRDIDPISPQSNSIYEMGSIRLFLYS